MAEILRPSQDGSSAVVAQGSPSLFVMARRFLTPNVFVSLYAFWKWRAKISPRAEVELTRNLQLGRRTVVSSFTKIKTASAPIVTGEDCGFATGCFIASGGAPIILGDHVICGPNVSIVAANYVYQQLDVPFDQQGITSQGITIGRNVWIGSGTVILDGSSIGDNSIVVANSLVNRRFPPNSIIQGNPAKVIIERRGARGPSNAES
jgi:acetyltransferase-like isoleucine patch superfamily enzyme